MEAVRGWLETGLAQRFNGRRIAICGSRLTMGSSMLGPSSKRRCRGAISTTGRRGPATNSRPTVTHTKLSFTQAVEIRHFLVPHGAIFHLHAGSTRVVEPVIRNQVGVWIKRIPLALIARQVSLHSSLTSEIRHETSDVETRHFLSLLNSGDTAMLLLGTRHAR